MTGAQRRALVLQIGLILVGLLSSFGYIAGVEAFRGLGFATVASPLPLVFSQFRGQEAFANDYYLHLRSVSGQVRDEPFDKHVLSSMGGPFVRRDAYAAMVSFGPFFSGEMELRLRDAVLHYGLCRAGALSQKYEMAGELESAEIFARRRPSPLFGADSKEGGLQSSWTVAVNCQK